MLDPLDDFPIHQTAVPLTVNGMGPNAYDRYFFNGYRAVDPERGDLERGDPERGDPDRGDVDGSVFFAVALGVYPNRRIIDAALCVMVDGVHHSVLASARMGDDRRRTSVGPITIHIDEPMSVLRIEVDHPEVGADITFEARTPPIQEPRFDNPDLTIGSFDYTRYTQFGGWRGTVTADGSSFPVDGFVGCRDRSWGQRGGRGADAAPVMPQFHWLWAPINFGDGGLHFDVNEHGDGRRWHEGAFAAPLLEPQAGPPWTQPVETFRTADYRLRLEPGTRWAAEVELTFRPWRDDPFSVVLEPVARFQMSTIGYGHPRFRHGSWVGEEVVEVERLVADEVDPAALGGFHVQQLVRATRSSDGAVGAGVLEVLIFGPHEPLGLAGIDDVAGHP